MASPVLEAHYLAIVLVPLAISRPRITALWLLPLVLWVTPADWPTDWQRIVFLAVGTANPRRPDGSSYAGGLQATTRWSERGHVSRHRRSAYLSTREPRAEWPSLVCNHDHFSLSLRRAAA